jgi:hypothetical protein
VDTCAYDNEGDSYRKCGKFIVKINNLQHTADIKRNLQCISTCVRTSWGPAEASTENRFCNNGSFVGSDTHRRCSDRRVLSAGEKTSIAGDTEKYSQNPAVVYFHSQLKQGASLLFRMCWFTNITFLAPALSVANDIKLISFLLWRCDPTRVMVFSFLRFSRSHTTTHHSR